MRLDEIKESAILATDTIRSNKLRSGLTILGMTVGVLTVMFMVSIIQGLNRSFAQQLEGIGTNLVFVVKFDPSFGRQPTQEERMREDFTLEDADALRAELPNVIGVSPIQRTLAETAVEQAVGVQRGDRDGPGGEQRGIERRGQEACQQALALVARLELRDGLRTQEHAQADHQDHDRAADSRDAYDAGRVLQHQR